MMRKRPKMLYMDNYNSLYEDVFGSTGDCSLFYNTSIDFQSIDRAARSIHHAMEIVEKTIQPNMTTRMVADIIDSILKDDDVDSGYIIMISPEEVAWHGIPDTRILQEGEIVSVDIACSFCGWWADASMTFPVGRIDKKRLHLINAAKAGTQCIIAYTRDGSDGHECAVKLSKLCEEYNVRLIPEAAGHSVGRRLHGNPLITYDGRTHEPLVGGVVYTVEPIFTCGNGQIKIASNGTAVTADGEPTAHFEVSVLTHHDNGLQILGAPGWISSQAVLTYQYAL